MHEEPHPRLYRLNAIDPMCFFSRLKITKEKNRQKLNMDHKYFRKKIEDRGSFGSIKILMGFTALM